MLDKGRAELCPGRSPVLGKALGFPGLSPQVAIIAPRSLSAALILLLGLSPTSPASYWKLESGTQICGLGSVLTLPLAPSMTLASECCWLMVSSE